MPPPSSISSSDARAGLRPLLAFAAAFVAFAVAVAALHFAMPLSRTSSDRYLMGVFDRQAMLAASKGTRRIVLVGGSGMGLSVSAEDLSRDLGRTVINTGVQAGIGYRNQWTLIAPHLDPAHDTIVLSPELSMLTADQFAPMPWCDVVFLSKQAGLLVRNPQCMPLVMQRMYEELRYRTLGEPPPESGVYRRSAFNASGDVVSHLGLAHATPDFSGDDLPARTSSSDIEGYRDFVRRKISRTGFATVALAPVVPSSVCRRYPDHVERIAQSVADLTTVPRIRAAGLVEDACFDDAYFFDGADHLDAAGRTVKTALFRKRLALLTK
jgi:hypothetical protein